MKFAEQMLNNKLLLTLILIFVSLLGFTQTTSDKKLQVSIIKNSKGQLPLRYSDTLNINFNGGFINDVVEIKSGGQTFRTKRLTSDTFDTYAGSLAIPKTKGRQQLTIYLNDSLVGKMILKKRFSAAHVAKIEKNLFWEYINRVFIYL